MDGSNKKPFIPARDSDGCTLISKPYQWLTGKQLKQRPCCVKHDERYHFGGTDAQRRFADIELRDCVFDFGDTNIEKVCFRAIGWMMYYAVRVGGSPKLPFPWRWRNNIGYELKDLLSGYKDTAVDYDEEKHDR
jgi:hypothetical protein